MASESERRVDLLREEQRIIFSSCRRTGELPCEVVLSDVQLWLRELEWRGNSASTC